MNFTNCPYVPGHTLFREELLTIYDAVHNGLGKHGSMWVYQLPTDSMLDVAEHFHRQLSLAGGIYHPDVSPIYMGGVEGQNIYCIQEPLITTSLAGVVSQAPPNTRETFYEIFAPLAQMLRTLNRLGLTWERMRLQDVVVLGPGRYRIQRWNPLCSMERVGLPSELAAKIAALPGLFFTEDVFDFDRNARALAHWMFESVTTQGRTLEAAIKDFQNHLKEKRKKTDPEPRFMSDVEPHIERFIYKLAMSKLQGGYDSIDDVVVALERVRRGATLEDWPVASHVMLAGAATARTKLFPDSPVAQEAAAAPSYTGPDFGVMLKQGGERRKIITWLLVALAVLVVGAAAWIGYQKFGHGNRPPTAMIIVLQSQAKVQEKVAFDASRSSDPDGDILHYHWRVIEPGGSDTNHYISRNRTPSARTTTIQFFRPGTYRIDLYVSDSRHISELDHVTITVIE